MLGNTFRIPALVATMAATVDHISQGRFTLSIGATRGWREHPAGADGRPTKMETLQRYHGAPTGRADEQQPLARRGPRCKNLSD